MPRFQSPSSSASQKVLENKPPQGSPTGTPMERVAHFQSLLLHVSQIPHKSSGKKKFYPSLEGPRKGTSPHVPQNGASMETDAHFQVLVRISFGVPSKGALPPGCPH